MLRRAVSGKRRGTFEPWEFEHRYSPEHHIARGEIAVGGNAVFRRQVDAMRCFGFTGKGYQRGVWRIPGSGTKCLWFPRLYDYGMWRNELSCGGTRIVQRALDEEGRASIEKQRANQKWAESEAIVVFAKRKDVLGFDMYRYVGTFRMNHNDIGKDFIRFDRVSDVEKIGAAMQ